LAVRIHSRRAETTLGPTFDTETSLKRIQLRAVRHSLNGSDLTILVGDGEHQAGHLRLTIDQDRAGAATGIVTAAFGAGQAEILAQNIEEQSVGLDRELVRPAVNVELSEFFIHKPSSWMNPGIRHDVSGVAE
jgi:hypothetical protein